MRLREHPGITEGRIDILFCKPTELQIEDGYNVRDLTTPQARLELDELKAEVKEHGIQTPLKVRFDGENIIVVEGHRRRIVALELLAEFKESEGAEGRQIEAVPIYAEAKGTTPLDRDFGLRHSNSGVPLKPLEFANLIYRTIHQRGLSEKDAAKGFGISIGVLRNHLAMRAMPEEVKQQVRDGDIAATTALKVTRDAKNDPEFAAQLIAANKEENARIRGKDKRHKVTAKTLKRDKEKAKSKQKPLAEALPQPRHPEPEFQSVNIPASSATMLVSRCFDADEIVGAHEPQPASALAATHEQAPKTTPTFEQMNVDELLQATTRPNGVKHLIDALEPFAALAEFNDLNAKSDDDVIEVKVLDIKRAWRAYTDATGTA